MSGGRHHHRIGAPFILSSPPRVRDRIHEAAPSGAASLFPLRSIHAARAIPKDPPLSHPRRDGADDGRRPPDLVEQLHSEEKGVTASLCPTY